MSDDFYKINCMRGDDFDTWKWKKKYNLWIIIEVPAIVILSNQGLQYSDDISNTIKYKLEGTAKLECRTIWVLINGWFW